jgi:hypothetical protein
VMGSGVGEVEVPFASQVLRETIFVTAVMGPPSASTSSTVVLFNAEGVTPVSAQVVFPSTLQSAADEPRSLELDVQVPLVPSWPEGPDVSVTEFESTIGPRGLRYVARTRGKRIEYVPVGLSVPTSCQPPGFVFRGTFGFTDGSQTTTTGVVPCPHDRSSRGTGRRRRHRVGGRRPHGPRAPVNGTAAGSERSR